MLSTSTFTKHEKRDMINVETLERYNDNQAADCTHEDCRSVLVQRGHYSRNALNRPRRASRFQLPTNPLDLQKT